MILLLLIALTYPVDSWQSEALEEALIRGDFVTPFPGVRPYFLSANDTSIIRPSLTNTTWDFWLDTVTVLRFKPRLYADWHSFSFLLQPVVKFGSDYLPPDRVFAGLFAGDYERASIRYRTDCFGLFIGRERFSLGPSPRWNLLLSGYGAPMDWFHYDFGSRRIRVFYFLSRLDDMTCKPVEYEGDTVTRFIDARRFLIIKRLDLALVRNWNFSFSEAATFGGENYGLDLYQLNPVVLLHTYQHNWDKAADLFFHLDTRVQFGSLLIYGALLVDDYQLEPDPNGEPNHLAFQAGFETQDLLLDRTWFMLEYTRVSRWTYCIFTPYQRYQYRGHPIGFPLGPDGDEVFGKMVWHLQPRVRDFWWAISLTRKGENEIDTPWPIPEEPRVPGTVFPADNFLYGDVQKTLDIRIGLRQRFSRHLAFDISAGFIHTVNDHHVRHAVKTTPALKIQLDGINLIP